MPIPLAMLQTKNRSIHHGLSGSIFMLNDKSFITIISNKRKAWDFSSKTVHFRGVDTIFQGVLIPPRQGVIATTSRVSIQNQLRMRILYFTDIQHKTNNTPSQHPINTHNLIKKAVNSRRFLY